MVKGLERLEALVSATSKSIPAEPKDKKTAAVAYNDPADTVAAYQRDAWNHLETCSSTEAQRCFVRQQQTAIIYLCDRVTEEVLPARGSTATKPADDQRKAGVMQALQGLLTFYEASFPEYFNQDALLPKTVRHTFVRSLKPRIKTIIARLRTAGADAGLMTLFDAIGENSTRQAAPITYREAAYAKLVLGKLEDLIATGSDDIDSALTRLLFRVNFNSRRFAAWYATRLNADLQALDDDMTRYQRLGLLLKEHNQMWVKLEVGLYPTKTSLKQMMVSWILDELEFFKARASAAMPQAGKEMVRIQSTLSVPQMACLIRLLVETGVVVNRNHSELMRVFAQLFTSAKTLSISPDSLRSKYYNLERTAIDGTRDLLLNMVHQSRKLQ